MTNKEAIEILKALEGLINWDMPLDYAAAIDKAVEALEKSRWIPCSERLPEKEGRYLCSVCAPYRNPREMIYAPSEWNKDRYDATWRSTDGAYVLDWFVGAWMPLPSPYREEGEE